MGLGGNGEEYLEEQEECVCLVTRKDVVRLSSCRVGASGPPVSRAGPVEPECAPQGSVLQHLFPPVQRAHLPSCNPGSCPDKHLYGLPVPDRTTAGSITRHFPVPFVCNSGHTWPVGQLPCSGAPGLCLWLWPTLGHMGPSARGPAVALVKWHALQCVLRARRRLFSDVHSSSD